MSVPPATPTSCAIEMRGVSIGALRDLNKVVVEDVNWSVAMGDFWVIGGLQGSGKSDFLMLTGGMTAPVSGTYCLLGQEMPIFEDHRLAERLRLGFVFENGQLFNHLTVAENISLPVRYHLKLSQTEVEAEVQNMLELTELTPWADSTPSTMARNWQRRAGLARALMLRPEVLLLDNPLAGLDLRHRAWWLNLLEQLSRGHDWMNRRPMTLIVTTNDLRLWRGHARQFAMLKDKHLVSLGDWARVEAASDDLVRELMVSVGQHN
jgi:ABC-type transporter Mla maintaining outer membrane lipid asymmetry ATPase subunit MlaF